MSTATICPPSGTGRRLVHNWILAEANRLAWANVSPEEARWEIRAGMTRAPFPGEIEEAIEKAYRERDAKRTGGAGSEWRMARERTKKAPPRRTPNTFRSYVEAGADWGEADLWEASPVRLAWEPGWEDAVLFFRNFFRSGDWVVCLDREDQPARLGIEVRERDAWMDEIRRRGEAGEKLPVRVGVNPVSPTPAKTKGGKDSLRCNDSVVALRNLVVEADALSLPLQRAFWAGWGVKHGWDRVRALIHTGGKSIHCVFAVDAKDADEWERRVKGKWMGEVFGPMGFDTANATPFRLTRLPGAVRTEGTASGEPTLQKLLFLNVEI